MDTGSDGELQTVYAEHLNQQYNKHIDSHHRRHVILRVAK